MPARISWLSDFLDFDRAPDHSHIFLENAQQALHLPGTSSGRRRLLDLNYYLPCRVAPVLAREDDRGGRPDHCRHRPGTHDGR